MRRRRSVCCEVLVALSLGLALVDAHKNDFTLLNNDDGLTPCQLQEQVELSCTAATRRSWLIRDDTSSDSGHPVPDATACTCSTVLYNIYSACILSDSTANQQPPAFDALNSTCQQHSITVLQNYVDQRVHDHGVKLPSWTMIELKDGNTFDEKRVFASLDTPDTNKWSTAQILAPIIVGVSVLIIAILVIYFLWRRRVSSKSSYRTPNKPSILNFRSPRYRALVSFPSFGRRPVRRHTRGGDWSIDSEEYETFQVVGHPRSPGEAPPTIGTVNAYSDPYSSPGNQVRDPLQHQDSGRSSAQSRRSFDPSEQPLWSRSLRRVRLLMYSLPVPWKHTVSVHSSTPSRGFRLDGTDAAATPYRPDFRNSRRSSRGQIPETIHEELDEHYDEDSHFHSNNSHYREPTDRDREDAMLLTSGHGAGPSGSQSHSRNASSNSRYPGPYDNVDEFGSVMDISRERDPHAQPPPSPTPPPAHLSPPLLHRQQEQQRWEMDGPVPPAIRHESASPSLRNTITSPPLQPLSPPESSMHGRDRSGSSNDVVSPPRSLRSRPDLPPPPSAPAPVPPLPNLTVRSPPYQQHPPETLSPYSRHSQHSIPQASSSSLEYTTGPETSPVEYRVTNAPPLPPPPLMHHSHSFNAPASPQTQPQTLLSTPHAPHSQNTHHRRSLDSLRAPPSRHTTMETLPPYTPPSLHDGSSSSLKPVGYGEGFAQTPFSAPPDKAAFLTAEQYARLLPPEQNGVERDVGYGHQRSASSTEPSSGSAGAVPRSPRRLPPLPVSPPIQGQGESLPVRAHHQASASFSPPSSGPSSSISPPFPRPPPQSPPQINTSSFPSPPTAASSHRSLPAHAHRGGHGGLSHFRNLSYESMLPSTVDPAALDSPEKLAERWREMSLDNLPSAFPSASGTGSGSSQWHGLGTGTGGSGQRTMSVGSPLVSSPTAREQRHPP